MNCDDGNLRYLGENEKPTEREIPVESIILTKKQIQNKKVSLKDHRSKAGKILTKIRHDELTKNQKRNMRKKLKKK
ncbi:MAG: hypothetical protein PF518_04790 [Spirochaetaceae bacterium]|jgi:hypothetical protein|nr:hypothetical protein [Spirochaetaceae bacterium]